MIEITFGKMNIPENERFIGFAGDNLHSTKTFVLSNVAEENCIYRLYLEFFDGGLTNHFVLDNKVENGSTYLEWNIAQDHILNTGLVKAQIKAFCDDEMIFHTSHDYFIIAPTLEFDNISKKEITEFLEYEKRLNEILSKITSQENGFVSADTKIAGLSLSQDITTELLCDSMKVYPILRLSSAPTKATVGKIGQLAFERSTPNGTDFVKKLYICLPASQNGIYNWVEIFSDNSANIKSISNLMINDNGELLVDFSNGENTNLGRVVGTDGENGKDGNDGQDGYSPTISVSPTETGYMLTIDHNENFQENVFIENGADGEKGEKGDTGAQGEKGADGYTPVKGVDYYTEEDKAEIESYIDEKLSENNQSQEIFTDVLAEVGYTENSRVNSSGNVVSWDNSDVTGYIPVKAGDVIRLKDMYVPDTYNETGNSYGQTAYAYTSDKTFIKSVFLCTVNDASLEALDRVIENGGVVQFTVASEVFGENVAYIIIGAAEITAESEVYVNSTIVSSNSGDIPAYWLSELTTKTETIQQAIETAGRNKSAFLWYTDAHWQTNSKISPYLLDYLCKNTPINKVNFGGDIINDPTEFTYENIKYAYEWRKLIAGLPNHHSVIGNHDANHNTTDVSKIAYSFLNAPEETADMIVGGDFYYYIDNPSEKTRYLYLSYLTNNHTEMMAQGEFIVDAIKSAPENWHIVAIAHRWFQYTSSSSPTVGSTPAYESEILKIFDEYNARTTHTASNYFTSQDFADGKAKVEFCIGGHIHTDFDFETDGGIPVIITTSDTNQDRVPGSSVDSGTLGTITESAVYGIVADYDNSTIKVIGVGRGTSREISC